jgi:hypothetical protein
MAELVEVRGLNRRGVRIGTKTVTNKSSSVIDLDDAVTRRDVSKHTTIGALAILGSVPVAVASGAVVSNGTTTTISTTAGSLLRNDGQVVTVAAVNNAALASAPDATNPRIDLVVVDNASGAVTNVAGTAAATPVIPVPAAGKTVLATVRVAANASTSAGVVITDVAPRL